MNFTITDTKKYKALILIPPNGYNTNTINIQKNGVSIYSRSIVAYSTNFFEVKEFELKKGDTISISTSTSTLNAVMLTAVVWL